MHITRHACVGGVGRKPVFIPTFLPAGIVSVTGELPSFGQRQFPGLTDFHSGSSFSSTVVTAVRIVYIVHQIFKKVNYIWRFVLIKIMGPTGGTAGSAVFFQLVLTKRAFLL